MKATAKYITMHKDEHNDIIMGIDWVYKNSSLHHRLNIYYVIFEVIKYILKERQELREDPLFLSLVEFLSKNYSTDLQEAGEKNYLHKQFVDLDKFIKSKIPK